MMIPAYMSAFTSSHPLAIRKSTSFSRELWYFVLLMIYEINRIWTAEMNWKWRKWSSQWTQFMQLRKEAWKNSGLQRGLNLWPCDYRCDALPTELWSHWRWEQVNIVGSYYVPMKEVSVNDIWNKSYMNCRKWAFHSKKCSAFIQMALAILLKKTIIRHSNGSRYLFKKNVKPPLSLPGGVFISSPFEQGGGLI